MPEHQAQLEEFAHHIPSLIDFPDLEHGEFNNRVAAKSTKKHQGETVEFFQAWYEDNPAYPEKRFPRFSPQKPLACLQCGTCAASCPVGAVLKTTYLTDDQQCIHCLRCQHACPTGKRKPGLIGRWVLRTSIQPTTQNHQCSFFRMPVSNK